MENDHNMKDDLPFVPYPIELTYVIPVYFNQTDQASLDELLNKYSEYDPALLDRIQFVVVDDGSQIPVKLPDQLDLNVLLLRIAVDKPWNQVAARNLGVVYSRSDKVLATDLDLEFDEDTLKHLVSFSSLDRNMYRFRRLDTNGRITKPHPNTFFMSRGRFLKFFGVDEEFCGAHGCGDGMFWKWQRYNGTRFFYLRKKYACRIRRFDHDTSYHSLKRDQTRNNAIKKRKIKEWETWGPMGGHSRMFLTSKWDVVEDRKRSSSSWKPARNRLWKKLWFIRQIFR